MLDAAKQREWYRIYFASALVRETHDTLAAAKRWARAMSLISEQFVDAADNARSIPDSVPRS